MIISMKLMRHLLLTALFLLVAAPAHAQLDSSFLGVQTELEADPRFPKPGEMTTVSFSNFGKYYNADVIWRLNGEVVADASNKREVKFVAGDIGETDVITATIVSGSGRTQVFAAEIVPTYIDIVLEPQTRVPDFYEGRALPSVGSQVNATVLVNNGTLHTGDYIYTWIVDGQVLEGGPIRGTNQVSFETPRGSQPIVQVSVSDVQGRVIGNRAIYFETVKPEIVFYESNALHGQSYNAISDSLILVGSAATLVAEPYYLDIRTYNNPDISEWEVDNEGQETSGSNPYHITIQKVDEGNTSKVSFHVRSTYELLQGAEDRINIVY